MSTPASDVPLSSLRALDFSPVHHARAAQVLSRPSLSYWQDAWRRLRGNRRAMVSLWVVVFLLTFTLAGPLLWRVDPSAQDVDQISVPPSLRQTAVVVAAYTPWDRLNLGADARGSVVPLDKRGNRLPEQLANDPLANELPTSVDLRAPTQISIVGAPSTQSVRLRWSAVPGASSYRIYRTPFAPLDHYQLGVPLGEVFGSNATAYEDLMDLRARSYYYSIVALGAATQESSAYRTVEVDVRRVITADEALEKGLVGHKEDARVGSEISLAAHPLGTDYLGRDLLARLMYGARVSLFIGIVAPLLYVLLGVLYGAIAGFLGGAVDAWMMRFADFMVALPFLLLMILMRVGFGIQGGESGITPMLIALVVLSWPSAARLVRGQILQIREEGYIQAARLLGAPTGYLVLRHMIPNTLGVILVTLTFAVPSAIFTEAFLSFIGMGVAPPTPSWGSMCNEGRKTMLATPHELIAPAVLISLTVLAFNLLGDGMRDALDARMRARE